jgi:transcription-repair coupling factor (superfamily II helicase)
MDETARQRFRERWREKLEGDPTKSASTRTSARASPPPASSTTCRCSSTRRRPLRLPGAQASLVLHGEVDEALQRFWTDTRERHRFLQHDPERPILPPEACS